MLWELASGIALAAGSDDSDRTKMVQDILQDHWKNKKESSSGIANGLLFGIQSIIDDCLVTLEKEAVGIHFNHFKDVIPKGLIIGYAHMSEMTYSWMNAIPNDDFSSNGTIKNSSVMTSGVEVIARYVIVNCPVDIEVYDKDAKLQLSIIDNVVYKEPDCKIDAFVNEDEEKIINIPMDVESDIKAIATDQGKVSYAIEEVDMMDAGKNTTIFYNDIDIEKDDVLVTSVGTYSENKEEEYSLYDQNNVLQEPSEILSEDQMEDYCISVNSTNGGTVEGGGYRKYKEYVRLVAIPEEGYTFDGWYDDNGNLVYSDTEYRFCVVADAVLTARFSEKEPESLDNAAVVLSKTRYTYNGKVQKPTIKTIKGLTLTEGTNYTAEWSNASSKKAGTYTVTITGIGSYTGRTKAIYKINKAANPLKIKAKTAKVKYSKLKKKVQVLKVSKIIKFTKNGQGRMAYKIYSAKKGRKSFKKYFKIDTKSGKLTIRKGLKKGTYIVKVKVWAAGDTNYEKSPVKTVTTTIKVK